MSGGATCTAPARRDLRWIKDEDHTERGGVSIEFQAGRILVVLEGVDGREVPDEHGGAQRSADCRNAAK
jgi:hypothetical protein